jgi:hypothetical protein
MREKFSQYPASLILPPAKLKMQVRGHCGQAALHLEVISTLTLLISSYFKYHEFYPIDFL